MERFVAWLDAAIGGGEGRWRGGDGSERSVRFLEPMTAGFLVSATAENAGVVMAEASPLRFKPADSVLAFLR
ncbi:hypothetical protein ACOCG7_34435 (plasmid) [Paraburkholderia sp. DD10]|uniref:hypothetical protein n=1 Tax=Paraburkholderia sp. DD10 TaxID=3409691 RepID=UPI003BA3DC0E